MTQEPDGAENAEPRGPGSVPIAVRVLREIASGSALVSVLAVVLALVVSGVLIAVTDEQVRAAAPYFASRPGDTLTAAWDAVTGAYRALIQGAVYNFRRDEFTEAIRPLGQTLTYATPLIVAGLGVGLSFRIGLFNVGGQGQILVAAAAAGWVGSRASLPWGLHLVAALVAGVIAGAFWGGIVGVLKAKTGAHEVIVTIMLNYVALYLVTYLLRTSILRAEGSNNPKSGPTAATAVFPKLFGGGFALDLGFLLAITAAAVMWWILERSSLGFQFRAVGENPSAARVGGMDVPRLYVWGMVISGATVGIAGAAQVQSAVTTGFSAGVDAGIGFNALTVALLGRSRPWGIVGAGILFGALKAGGFAMQAAENIPIDILLVVQSLIVLFVAAPAMVRTVFRLPRVTERTAVAA